MSTPPPTPPLPPSVSRRPAAQGPLSSASSDSTVRVSSPLNPHSTSAPNLVLTSPTPLPEPPPLPALPATAAAHGRGISLSAPSSPPLRGRARSISSSSPFSPRSASPSPARSISPIRLGLSRSTGSPGTDSGPDTPSFALTLSAHPATPPPPAPAVQDDLPRQRTLSFGALSVSHRPWRETPRKKKTVPAEQTAAYLHTRERVSEATRAVLGTTLDVAHAALELSSELLQLAPVPGLAEAARTLLGIWDALQMVDMNRMACLRLTERCADVLWSVREEVGAAGESTGEELKEPVQKLTEAFAQVHVVLQKQAHRPFLKRYLKRDEDLRELAACDGMLTDAMSLFGLSIQIRLLKTVQANERRRAAENAALIKALEAQAPTSPSGNALGLTTDDNPPVVPSGTYAPPPYAPPTPPAPASAVPLGLASPAATVTASPPLSPSDPDRIRALLHQVRSRQNEADLEADARDLRQLMRAALQTNSDAELIEVLQVGRDEMPEAIKTLQRALEREVERETQDDRDALAMMSASAVSDVSAMPPIVGGLSASVTTADPEAAGTREERAFGTVSSLASVRSRSSTLGTEFTGTTSTTDTDGWGGNWGRSAGRDTLDREFMEGGIEAMRRMSRTTESLPSWTITRYEVDRDEKIGVGFFSDVYKGTWRGRTVAIKCLAPTTPKAAFVHEIAIWKKLDHPNVQTLYGASSASSDPPWFFVSPYYKNGSLVTYLKNMESLKEGDALRMIHQIAKGMTYLHGQGVLHGDFKVKPAANVLVNDRGHCVITDFGQSEMKSEVARISATPPPHGTLRWQSPELVEGAHPLTQAMDVYAFAMCCYEILTKGGMPWPNLDDDTVRHLILREGKRPPLPVLGPNSAELNALIRQCWDRNPSSRPGFAEIAKEIKRIRHRSGKAESPVPPPIDLPEEPHSHWPSPDPRPIELTDVDEDRVLAGSPDTWPASFKTALSVPGEWTPTARTPAPSVHGDQSSDGQRRASESTDEPEDSRLPHSHSWTDNLASPPPPTQSFAEARDERRYRMLLQHEFHQSLTLPLWTPQGCVPLGAVGYLSKPEGTFVTLLNAFDPVRSSNGLTNTMASVHGYGRVNTGSVRQDKRSAAQRGLDTISGWFAFRNDSSTPPGVRRQYSFHLHMGHKAAWFVSETTTYRYIDNLEAPKKWFMANADTILQLYRPKHPLLQKEDLYFIFGCLDAPEYGQLVFSAPKAGQPWGEFALEHEAVAGPAYAEEAQRDWNHKVTRVSDGSRLDTVILARLRFKPDVAEPTSL
ncbi:hypothetical protein PUNSTDRAFT_46534 [Punctularia strigosozonata HHB-11173 SS5]|uniref:uncharacterized protein n=1 Tax=Punctularia strigosozonata (strain HHB-11173) TaxID=741275 RepID=UPI000441853F|nr:uncharacterized protein PUNSTDRAFT_46534 [Punctularia strigosozonata HHB-11173 SS5]EIN05641.1 hypothetical protein PUNSTDRAFT_46534 [Punctularia strigosozonata HHB-11173 SS5]